MKKVAAERERKNDIQRSRKRKRKRWRTKKKTTKQNEIYENFCRSQREYKIYTLHRTKWSEQKIKYEEKKLSYMRTEFIISSHWSDDFFLSLWLSPLTCSSFILLFKLFLFLLYCCCCCCRWFLFIWMGLLSNGCVCVWAMCGVRAREFVYLFVWFVCRNELYCTEE